MIIQERIAGRNLIRTYSSEGYNIIQDQTGIEYSEAIDIENSGMTYTEVIPDLEEEISDSEALSIIMGRNKDEQENSDELSQED